MLFWSFILLISALCMIVIWRSWVTSLQIQSDENSSDAGLYKIRLEEIERDLNSGLLDTESAEAAKAEEGRKLLRANKADIPTSLKHAESASGWWMTSALVSVPVVSIVLYLMLGTPPTNLIETAEQPFQEQSLEDLIKTAEKRMQSNPDDINGWKVLAPVYLRQNDFAKAENALRNILRLEGPSSGLLSTLGEVLVGQANGRVSDDARGFFEQSIALDSSNANARFYVGMAQLQSGDQDSALKTWQAMVDDAEGDEAWLPTVRQRIEQLTNPQSQPSTQTSDPIASLTEEQLEEVNAMVASLASKLDEDPENKQGWERLVRAYIVLGDRKKAEEAFWTASRSFPNDQEFLDGLKSLMTELPVNGE